jgi:hypothetical protein
MLIQVSHWLPGLNSTACHAFSDAIRHMLCNSYVGTEKHRLWKALLYRRYPQTIAKLAQTGDIYQMYSHVPKGPEGPKDYFHQLTTG